MTTTGLINTFGWNWKSISELELIEPFDHPVYHQKFEFAKGLPKIHEHDGKPGKDLGWSMKADWFFYSYECDLGNGWEDIRVHNTPEVKHQQALQMGANLISVLFYFKVIELTIYDVRTRTWSNSENTAWIKSHLIRVMVWIPFRKYTRTNFQSLHRVILL